MAFASERPITAFFAHGLLAAFALAGLAPAAELPTGSPGLVVQGAGLVHELSPDQARNATVNFVGTVTYYDPIEQFIFVQDKTGAVFIDANQSYPVHTGDLIRVEGRASPGFRTEVALNPVIRVVGRGAKYRPIRARYSELASGSLDCRLVKIRGEIRAANVEQHEGGSLAHLDVVMPGGEVQVYLAGTKDFRPESLLDASIELTGVAGGSFARQQQLTGVILYSPSVSSIRVLRRPTSRLDELPISSLDKVYASRYVVDSSRRVRVRGTVTYFNRGDAAVLESDGRSIFVQTRQTEDLSVGDVVDAYGYASDREYAPSLHLATLFRTGTTAVVPPHPVSYDEAISGTYSDSLVSMSGLLVSQIRDPRSDTLALEIDGRLVRARLTSPKALPAFPIGSRIKVTGVCRVDAGGPWRTPYMFHVDLRTPADIQVLVPASWWTVGHLIALLGALGVSAMVIVAWAASLRRRVKQQTVQIQRAMLVASERSRLLETVSLNRDVTAMLDDICNSVMILLPGATCVVRTMTKAAADQPGTGFDPQDRTLFQADLFDCEEKVVGRMIVRAGSAELLPADAGEVCKTLAEVAVLAVRQATFHQGLLHHSTHDPLTDLPNRRFYERTLMGTLEMAAQQDLTFVTIYIDVNRFKIVNDHYGHEAGDLYLDQISSRLLECLRSTDTLARIGGDEFMVLACPMSQSEGHALIERLRACFDQPFALEEVSLKGSASFGLAVYPHDGLTVEDLQRHADQAMYVDKRSSAETSDARSGVTILTPSELKTALDERRCSLVYQPQFTAKGRLAGLEALLRVEDPILGTLSPGAFIKAAEHSDVILEVGRWVLEQALEDAMGWGLHVGDPVVLAVNVAARQAQQQDFAEGVLACLAEKGFPPDRLELELVERSLAINATEVRSQLSLLRRAGVRVCLDDFGMGESSLTVLHKLPVDTIKLDRAFIQALESEPEVLPIVQAISSMARSMNKRVVAEGIEVEGVIHHLPDPETMDFQGFLFSHPVKRSEVGGVLQAWRSGILMPKALRDLAAQADPPGPMKTTEQPSERSRPKRTGGRSEEQAF